MVEPITIIITAVCIVSTYIGVNRLLKGPDWRFGFLHSYLLWGLAGALVVFGFLLRLAGGVGFALEGAGLDFLIWMLIGGIGPSIHIYAGIFKVGKGTKEYVEENSEEVWEATGTVLETADTVTGAVADHEKKKREKEEKKKREQQKRERERERQRKQDKREQMEEDVIEILDKARSNDLSSPNIDVLWEMNCDRCGITWATTQNKKLMRSDDFRTHNFNVVNEKDWSYIQDRVEIQCDAPDCNNVKEFTKDSLWSL